VKWYGQSADWLVYEADHDTNNSPFGKVGNCRYHREFYSDVKVHIVMQYK
jgi:hypothetical protein